MKHFLTNRIVNLITDDDGCEHPNAGQWHLVTSFGDANRTVCTGEAFGEGESACTFEFKTGKITCQNCIDIVNFFKKVKI